MIQSALIVTSLVGAGLEQEAKLLKSLLESYGVAVSLVHYTDMSRGLSPVDVMISLEVILPRTLALAKKNIFFPNSEWWNPKNEQYLPRFQKIFCKTQDCLDIWTRKVGYGRCVYTSFEARDLYDSSIKRQPFFLHVAGKNGNRNTKSVIDCWIQNDCLPPLTVVCSIPSVGIPARTKSPIQLVRSASESDLKFLMNSNQYHIIPSEYEGFGHALNEGIGCNAMVATTDAAPMNSYSGICRSGLIKVSEKVPKSLAILNKVSSQDVYTAVQNLLTSVLFDPDEPRNAFLSNREFFREKFWQTVSE